MSKPSWKDTLAALGGAPENEAPPEQFFKSPLQTLRLEAFKTDRRGNELVEAVLRKTIEADSTCTDLYKMLYERAERLSDEAVTAKFPWRIRVGGMRGFRDLLLPAFHPVYGIPYIPASSLKGVIRSWARQHLPQVEQPEIDHLLGYTNMTSIGSVQILDAFPMEPCLSIDIANPQWKWEADQVRYGAVPHHLLSMENATLKIGLLRTSRGTLNDVQKVKEWLENALLTQGLGSRVSAGYGVATKVNKRTRSEVPASNTSRCKSKHPFELWSQGIFGASTEKPEFRPVAIRGMLRYWFRAIALSLYSSSDCRRLERELFGAIEPIAEGSLRISGNWQTPASNYPSKPFVVTGKIFLEAQSAAHLSLVEKLLELSFHLGGVGRGSRRPLHWNRQRLRGCHWQPHNGAGLRSCSLESWKELLREVQDAFATIQPLQGNPADGHPGEPGNRRQDVLNSSAQIILFPCPKLSHPANGLEQGQAMNLFYNPSYKGKSLDNPGNPNVGGGIDPQTGSTPSYVLIKSVFPVEELPYQVVTIFGADHPDRRDFAMVLQDRGGLLVDI